MDIKIVVIFLTLAISAFNQQVSGETATCNFKNGKSFQFCYMTEVNPTGEPYRAVTEMIDSEENVKKVTYLNGSNMTFTTFTSFFCNKYKNLYRIFIIDTLVEEIEEDSFENCKELKNVKFDNSKLHQLSENLFVNNPKLTFISFFYNSITSLPENLFAHQSELNKLVLAQSQISSLPLNIFKNLVNLETLVLSYNQLSTIHVEWFENLTSLKTLFLSRNNITDIPKNAFVNTKNLTSLIIQSNDLTVIHADSFGVNRNFEILFAENNKINAIDEKLIENTGLNHVELKGNICTDFNAEERFEIKELYGECFENYKGREE